MCWRILRIEGDGSIKIILAKEDLCDTIPSSDTESALINNTGTVVYGYDSNSKADYINYSGGLYSTLKSWYITSGLEDKKMQLKNEKWCLGGNNNYRYNFSTGTLLTDITSSEYYYAAGKRLYGIGVEKNATFKCSSEEDSINDYIGTISADEIVYAGGAANSINKTFFLNDNAQSSYWSLSRSNFNGHDNVLYMINNGYLDSNPVSPYRYCVRPAVTLATGTQISGGNGTISNP